MRAGRRPVVDQGQAGALTTTCQLCGETRHAGTVAALHDEQDRHYLERHWQPPTTDQQLDAIRRRLQLRHDRSTPK